MQIEINYKALEEILYKTKFSPRDGDEPGEHYYINSVEIEKYRWYDLICLVREDKSNPYNDLQVTCINWLQSTVDYHLPDFNWFKSGPIKFWNNKFYYGEKLVGEINLQTDLGAAMLAIVNKDWLEFVTKLCKLEYGFISNDIKHSSKAVLGNIDINDFKDNSKVTRLLQNNKQNSPKNKLANVPPVIIKQLPNGQNKIIDGHHRIASSVVDGVKYLGAIILS